MMRGWKSLVEDLPKVTQPMLMFLSAEDHVVDPSSAKADPGRRIVARFDRADA